MKASTEGFSVKTEAQLDLQALHRVRDRWIGRKAAVINRLRGSLLEHGITVAAGPAHLKRQIPSILEDYDRTNKSRYYPSATAYFDGDARRTAKSL